MNDDVKLNSLPAPWQVKHLEQVGAATPEAHPKTRSDMSPPTTDAAPGDRRSLSAPAFSSAVIVGLVRQRIFAHYFGSSAEGDAFSAAFRIPNFLQNVFGEGALSASFIPVYAKLLAQDDEKEAETRRKCDLLGSSRCVTPSSFWSACSQRLTSSR